MDERTPMGQGEQTGTAGPRPLSVTELARRVEVAVDRGLGDPVWVEGEVSGARATARGHVYFALKDERAAIDVVLFKTRMTLRTRAMIADGACVQLFGRVTFWTVRGRLQFVAERVAPAGRGAQLAALERLKGRLAAEGLFEPARRRKLPMDPRIVGVLTSAHGAAIHDIIAVTERRGGARVLLAPAQVQGEGAAASIVAGLAMLARVGDVDVVILGRGGGSAEDLAAFNDESVARAVAAHPVPIVSAVGHETDVTLVDLVADARAATPSEAAELVVPDRAARRESLRLCSLRLARAARHGLAGARARLSALAPRLAGLHPGLVLARQREQVGRTVERMSFALRGRLAAGRAALGSTSGRLDAMSPLGVLARGYALATTKEGRAVRSQADVTPGDRIDVRVRAARLEALVLGVAPVPPERDR